MSTKKILQSKKVNPLARCLVKMWFLKPDCLRPDQRFSRVMNAENLSGICQFVENLSICWQILLRQNVALLMPLFATPPWETPNKFAHGILSCLIMYIQDMILYTISYFSGQTSRFSFSNPKNILQQSSWSRNKGTDANVNICTLKVPTAENKYPDILTRDKYSDILTQDKKCHKCHRASGQNSLLLD